MHTAFSFCSKIFSDKLAFQHYALDVQIFIQHHKVRNLARFDGATVTVQTNGLCGSGGDHLNEVTDVRSGMFTHIPDGYGKGKLAAIEFSIDHIYIRATGFAICTAVADKGNAIRAFAANLWCVVIPDLIIASHIEEAELHKLCGAS